MTALSLNEQIEMIKSAGIEYIPADKKFYKQYPFAIQIKKSKGSICHTYINARDKSALAELDAFVAITTAHIRSYNNERELLEKISRRIQRRDNVNNIFYFSKMDDVLFTINADEGKIIETVRGPIGTAHEKLLTTTNNLEIRSKLYYNKYRYKICIDVPEIAKQSLQLYNQIDSIINQSNDPKVTWVNKNVFFEPTWWHPGIILYLNDQSAFIMLKMLLNEHTKSTVEVKLHSEL